ncbi:MAG TPA: hypothetical protein VMZ91_12410 [Candidatus Paceibacterota bacterium]|nr:hypothetical protein [Candidatus Paceibacterota bacterium]
MKKSELEIDEFGNKYWCLNGQRHREDGPAVEWVNGDKFWYLNGECHRIDGPAIEYSNGDKSWYLNGKKVKEEDIIDFNPIITEREYINFVINL